MSARYRFIARETLVGALVNSLLSYVIFWLTFGDGPTVQVFGIGNFIFDFIPQGFMIALMSTLVPGALARRAMTKGRFEGGQRELWILPDHLLPKALILAVAAAFLIAIPTGMVFSLFLDDYLDRQLASFVKVVFGAVISLCATPIALRSIIPKDAGE